MNWKAIATTAAAGAISMAAYEFWLKPLIQKVKSDMRPNGAP